MSIISAIFHDGQDVRAALDWLRTHGVAEDAITVVTNRGPVEPEHYPEEQETVADIEDHPTDTAKGALQGAAVGGGVGLLFGLASILIPGAGFVVAGALAHALGATGATLAAGALVGATAGSIAGIFTTWGLPQEEAHYYAGEVERGATYVGVNTDRTRVSSREIATALARFNGRVRGGDVEHPAGVEKTARGTLFGPAAVSEPAPVLDTLKHRPPSHSNVLVTESTTGYISPTDHYEPALAGSTGEHHDDRMAEMKAPIAEDRPRAHTLEDEEEEPTRDPNRVAR